MISYNTDGVTSLTIITNKNFIVLSNERVFDYGEGIMELSVAYALHPKRVE